jgi:DeoR/GlpR family transcriptional regulator of sugar metabolism
MTFRAVYHMCGGLTAPGNGDITHRAVTQVFDISVEGLLMKRKSQKSDEIATRKSLFWILLAGEGGKNVGTEVSIEDFITKAKEKAHVDLTPRTILNTLQQMRKEHQHEPRVTGTSLIVGKKYAKLVLAKALRIVDERASSRPETKRRIGDVTWRLLFTAKWPDKSLTFEVPADGARPAFAVFGTDRLKRKILAIRKKSPVGLFVDAGSSTTEAIAQLLDAKTMPIRVDTGTGSRLLIPNITTNSPEIALMVSKSPHSGDIGVTLIGGELRPDRGSICGSLTQLWLNLWQSKGGLTGDVSIIGSTGYRNDRSGSPSFGSGHFDESQVKAAFLAATLLRVIILDSSKLNAEADAPNIFASMEVGNVDLVVIDDGENKYDGVTAFRKEAQKHGVATAIVITPDQKRRPATKSGGTREQSVSDGDGDH